MAENGTMYKRLYLVGIAAYIVMLILSIVFYKERTIFLDAAFALFTIIKDNCFSIQHYRFGDCCSQVLALLAVKAGLPISQVALCYSSGIVFYFLFAYFICGSILKRYDLALVILLMNILIVSDTFYFIGSPLAEGVAMLMIVFGMFQGNNPREITPLMLVVLLFLFVTVIFLHPLVIFVLLFMVIFFLLDEPAIMERKKLLILLAVYFIGLAVKSIFFRTYYEGSSLSGLKNFVTQFPDYFTIYSNRRFLYDCLVKYYWIPVLFTGIVVFYAKTGARKKLLLFVAFFFGYLMLANISYPSDGTGAFYMEALYLPLSIFLAVPFVFDLLPVMDKQRIAIPVVALIICTGCIRIYGAHTVYTQRLVLERGYLDKYNSTKVIIKAKKSDSKRLIMLWGAPYEFWLLSTIERSKSASIIIDEEPKIRDWAKDQKKALIVNWNIFPYKDLNPRYFHFTDTVNGYIVEQ